MPPGDIPALAVDRETGPEESFAPVAPPDLFRIRVQGVAFTVSGSVKSRFSRTMTGSDPRPSPP
ncbi:hypothetical protein [Methanoculleus chikugoensis]|uniref:hypothetical protein n=1 Tax=Methanoculleus chikugoensis TaxID=118126 RepID=UPI0006D14FED|nr:hypothetical protein [Methanoculleus chikugoensis]